MISVTDDVGQLFTPARSKRMDHIYEEIIAGSCKKMKSVRHRNDDDIPPTPCKRNADMLSSPCKHGRRVMSPCQSLGPEASSKMSLTSTSVLNKGICISNDEDKSITDTVKHLKTQGQLKLSANIVQGVLELHVIQGRQLSSQQRFVNDTFVKVSIIPGGDSKQCGSKTSVVTDSTNPLYDHKFTFVIAAEDLKKRVYISVWNSSSKSSKCEFLGGMSFGIQHLLNPEKDIMGWYHLLTEDVSCHKHLRMSTKTRMTPYKKVLADKKTSDNDTITVTISRGSSGFGFTVVDSCPVKVGKVDKGSPAAQAGLCPGDHVIAVNGHNVSRSQSSSVAKIVKNGGQTLIIDIQRASQMAFIQQLPWQPEHTLLLDPMDMRRSHDKGYTSESDLSDTDEGIYSWPSNQTSTPKKTKKSESPSSEKGIQKLIHQLCTAETSFIDIMHAGMQLYSRPLRHSILTPQQHTSLFQNIEKLVMISQFQVKQIQNNIPASESSSESDSSTSSSATEIAQNIGKIYQSKVSVFCQAYDLYAKGITAANKVLSDLSSCEDFIKFVRNSSLDSTEPSISSFIYLPIQHIVRVYNILQQILVSLDDSSLASTMDSFRVSIDNMISYPSVVQILTLASLVPISPADIQVSRSSSSSGSRGHCDRQPSVPSFQEY